MFTPRGPSRNLKPLMSRSGLSSCWKTLKLPVPDWGRPLICCCFSVSDMLVAFRLRVVADGRIGRVAARCTAADRPSRWRRRSSRWRRRPRRSPPPRPRRCRRRSRPPIRRSRDLVAGAAQPGPDLDHGVVRAAAPPMPPVPPGALPPWRRSTQPGPNPAPRESRWRTVSKAGRLDARSTATPPERGPTFKLRLRKATAVIRRRGGRGS